MSREFVIGAVILLAAGCRPNQANIALRRQVQGLEQTIACLESEKAAARARIAGLERPAAPATQPVLEMLFTVHAVRLGRLSSASPGRVKLYLTPTDETGEALKAVGTVDVEALDLGSTASRPLARWQVPPVAMRERWRSLGPLQAFVLELPWPAPPPSTQIGVKIDFEDALTNRRFQLLEKLVWEP
jgi:outer membrane murein-binding lipoprotein Lpp